MKSAPCEERDGRRAAKCFPHLYVDEMSAVSPEFKCLVWIDFPARILCVGMGAHEVQSLSLASGFLRDLRKVPSLLWTSVLLLAK